jgi:metal-dependent amidase/aminoacylase/carboxypeptidase family protein
MAILEHIKLSHGEMAEWRHDIHAHPEAAFEEQRTSALVAKKLQSFGLSVHQGLGNGPGAGSCMLHNPHYDFNDEVLPLGASYLANLVEHILAARA